MRNLKFYLVLSCLLGFLLASSQDTLIYTGANWKYLDDGSNQGTAWRANGFDDSAWPSGNAQLGYGDGDETTVLSYGGDPNNKYITYYFRKEFNVANPASVTGLSMELLRDDGAVIYLNGTEVVRTNMPSGTINYTTTASSAIGGSAEDTYNSFSIDPSYLVTGTNTLAIEIHQANNTSSDISMDAMLAAVPPSITRGPYLQMAGPNSMVVKWRTNVATASKVKYGLTSGSQSLIVEDTNPVTDHEIKITGLTPATQYFYSVGYGSTWLAGEDINHYFYTAPPVSDKTPFRAWILGDAGTANQDQRDVRDAYYTYAGSDYTELMLFLGDNAYNDGTDNQYQNAVFDVYDGIMKNTASFSCPGNHEFYNGNTYSSSQTGPFYDIFTLPSNGELGGLSTGTEAYYSFDYGNVHFISMDSHDSPRGTNDPMLTWLANDLAATTQEWIIVYFHHPPYTKGSHDSDSEGRLIDMRQNALPILESYGVDLVLSGHSHSYERSYLLNGHYGNSSTFNLSTMAVDATSGNTDTACAYRKETVGSTAGEGAVYITAGSSGKKSGGSLDHPAMRVNLNELGSVILEVDSSRLDIKFIDDVGTIQDYFTILKDEAVEMDTTIAQGNSVTLTASWSGSYTWSTGASTQSIVVSPSSSADYTVEDPNSCQREFFNITVSNGNDAPTAIKDVATTVKNSAAVIDVTKNDVDPEDDLDLSSVSIISSPANGSTSINSSTGAITYTPAAGFIGTDILTYEISDNGNPSPVYKDTATVYITVNADTLAIGKDTVGGKVFMDDDLNGTFNGEDLGMPAISVKIYEDVDGNDSVSAGDILQNTVVSNVDGDFTASVNAPGNSQLNLQISSSGNDATEDNSGNVSLDNTELYLGRVPQSESTVDGNFITAGSTWKYLDDGSNQGTAWRAIGFDDSGWPSGGAQLGYGDGDESTVLSYGGDPNNKHITYYFRQSFDVSDPSVFSTLDLEIIRDDGAVVYLNDTEIYRTNMPGGGITYTTTASSAIGGGDEDTWNTSSVDPALLVSGTNVLSVEIHQANSSSSDVSFDCKLTGTTGTTNFITEGDTWKYLDDGSNQGTAWQGTGFDDSGWPSGGAQLGYGDGDETTTLSYGGNGSNKYITYYFRKSFNVSAPGDYSSLDMEILRDDGAVVYLNGTEVYRTNMPGGSISYTTTASNGIGGGDEDIWHTNSIDPALLVSGNNVIAVEIHQVSNSSSDISFDFKLSGTEGGTTVLSSGDTWNYLDDGSNQGSAWRAPGFDDANWSSGSAQLGYGGNGETTTVGYGPDPNNKYATTYFRNTFTVSNPSNYSFLKIELLRDDGAVVYINGEEVVRSNMPDGDIIFLTNASNVVSNAEETTFFTYYVSADVLVPGTNEVAVEVHQQNGSSSDLGMDLSLIAESSEAQTVGLRFININIPNASTIQDAYLKMVASDHVPAGSEFVIKAENADNSAGFTSSANNLTSRTTVSDSIIWYYPDAAVAGDTITGPSMISLVQNIVNRPGWTAGNSISFFISGSGLRKIHSYDGDNANAPMLSINYNDGGAGSKNYVMEVDTNDLPEGYTFSTDNTELASFSAANQTDNNNDFGYVGSSTNCYAVGDGENNVASDVTLHIVNRKSGTNILVGNLNAESVESMAWNKTGDTLFAMAYDELGIVNTTNGAFTAIGSSTSAVSGSAGNITIDDIDGLSFDHSTNTLFGTQRRNGNPDILLKFNRNTGAFIPNAFGTDDYVEITGTNIENDVDDIAIDPTSGQMYAVNNDGGGVTQLISIDKTTGTGSVIGPLGVEDMEGQGFSSDGTFYGSSGNNSQPQNNDHLWRIDITNGDTTRIGAITNGTDYEGCDCITDNPKNRVYGTVFNDLDSNGVFDNSDTGYANTMVYIYDDANGNGIADNGEPVLDSMLTNSNGDFNFLMENPGDYALDIRLSDLPGGHVLTTDNAENASFGTFGQTDNQNNFGFNMPPGSLLPLDLLHFNAYAMHEQVMLKWETEHEINTSHFEVERSRTQGSFEKIGTVAANFNNNLVNTYQSIDESPIMGINYYRLRMVDKNGNYSYSNVKKVLFKNAGITSVSIAPNPSDGKFRVKVTAENPSDYLMIVYDITGRKLIERTVNSMDSNMDSSFDLSKWGNGTYQLQIISPYGESRTIQVLIM